jgi:hypothetical protein
VILAKNQNKFVTIPKQEAKCEQIAVDVYFHGIANMKLSNELSEKGKVKDAMKF